jgi:DNA-binding XRE family transcriptional regulator
MYEPLGLRGPFVIRLRGRIPRPAGYPETPRTLGDHLKKARLDRGIPQREAAMAIGCNPLTFLHWERGRVAPDVRFWPQIVAFLGYDPRPEPAGFGGRD